MAASLFSQPPMAYFLPLGSDGHQGRMRCEKLDQDKKEPGSRSLTEFETISSKICGWAGELGKDHDLRQRSDHCAWLFSEQAAPFHVGSELPSSALIPTAQGQPRVDFLSSASAMKNIFRAACDAESDMGVLVHRLGDWLVIDDGTEIFGGIGAGAAPAVLEEQRRIAAERRHRLASSRCEAAKKRMREAQHQCNEARAALWRAELNLREADEDMEAALLEQASAAAECKRHGLHPTSAGAQSSRGPGSKATEPGSNEDDISQLYRNFLGHSIRQLQDDHREETGLGGLASGLAVLGSPAAFRQVGVWKIADDATVVVGSSMLCLGNAEHPKLTLYLHDADVVPDMMLLEYWVECLMAGVPEFAICQHRDGAVQSYTLYKVSELRHFLEERLAIGQRLRMTLEVLRWIKRQCCFEGCTYWISKSKSDPTLKLFNLSGSSGRCTARCSWHQPLPPRQNYSLVKELVVKNTFLDLVTEAEAEEFAIDEVRRAQSCPARLQRPMTSSPGESDDDAPKTPLWPTAVDPHLSLPLRRRVAALFFRRAVSSKPSPEAARFLRHALQLEAGDVCSDASEDSSSDKSRLALQACCNLALAVCEVAVSSPALTSQDTSSSPSETSEKKAQQLLASLLADSPASASSPRLLRLPGRLLRAPLLFLAVPGHGRGKGASRQAQPTMSKAAAALSFVGAALASLSSVGGNLQHVEALGIHPTAAFVLLSFATAALHARQELLAWRSLQAACSFAALAAGRRPKLHPIFESLPSSEELLVRVEHLCGTILSSCLRQGVSGVSSTEPELRVFESWLLDHSDAVTAAHQVYKKGLAGTASGGIQDGGQEDKKAGASCGRDEECGVLGSEDGIGVVETGLPGLPGLQSLPECGRHATAVRHFEQAVRLLPPQFLQPGAAGALMHHLMLALATSLVQAAAEVMNEMHASTGAHGDVYISALLRANSYLIRAEQLAAAVGRGAVAAMSQGSRAELLGLAADFLVSSETLSRRDVRRVQQLCAADTGEACEDGENRPEGRGHPELHAEEASMDDEAEIQASPAQLIGRLGDAALNLALAAQQSTDAVVEPEAAAVLNLMCSGSLQAAAERLRVLPPAGLEEADVREAIEALLNQAVKFATCTLSGAPSIRQPANAMSCSHVAPLLCAHANLALCELHLAATKPGREDRQRSQRLLRHLDRARAALHGRRTDSDELDEAAALLLVHVHLVHVRLLGLEARVKLSALDELLEGCRLAAAVLEIPAASQSAWNEVHELLLRQMRAILRDLCATPKALEIASRKEFYRAVLQLSAAEVVKIPAIYDRLQARQT